MRVLMLSHVRRDPNGGAAQTALELAARWRQAGWEVQDFFSDDLPSVRAGRLSPDLGALAVVPMAVRYFDSVDAVITTGPLGWAVGAAARASRRRPVLVNLTYGLEHFDYEAQLSEFKLGRAPLSHLARFRWRLALRNEVEFSIKLSDLFVAPRARDTERAVRAGWISANRTLASGWGVNDAVFGQESETRKPWSGKVVWCGTTVERKGWGYFVEGFTSAARLRPELTLQAFGTQMTEAAIRAQFPADVASRVSAFPLLSRKEQFRRMAQCDVFVSASLSEGYHLALQEALAIGIPCISTEEGFVADLPPRSRPVLTIPKQSGPAISENLCEVAADPEARYQLSTLGRAWGRQHSWPRVAENIGHAIESLIHR